MKSLQAFVQEEKGAMEKGTIDQMLAETEAMQKQAHMFQQERDQAYMALQQKQSEALSMQNQVINVLFSGRFFPIFFYSTIVNLRMLIVCLIISDSKAARERSQADTRSGKTARPPPADRRRVHPGSHRCRGTGERATKQTCSGRGKGSVLITCSTCCKVLV